MKEHGVFTKLSFVNIFSILMNFISFFIQKQKKKNWSFERINSREIFEMTSFAKICSREIFKIWPFAKINRREMSKKFIRENKFSRKLIPLRQHRFHSNTNIFDTFFKSNKNLTILIVIIDYAVLYQLRDLMRWAFSLSSYAAAISLRIQLAKISPHCNLKVITIIQAKAMLPEPIFFPQNYGIF